MKKFIASALAVLVLASVSFAGPFGRCGGHLLSRPVVRLVTFPVRVVVQPVARVVGTVGNVVSYPVTGQAPYQGVFTNGGCSNGKCSIGR